MAKRYDPLRSKTTTTRRTVSWIDKRSGDTFGKPYKPKKVKLGATPKPRRNPLRARKPATPTTAPTQPIFNTFSSKTEPIVNKVSGETYDDAAIEKLYQEILAQQYNEDILKKTMHCTKEKGYRYLLQTELTQKPLFVIGANPSTADETTDDPTVRTIKKIAAANGFDGVIILNLYPLICTNPDDLPQELNATVHKDNLQVIKSALAGCRNANPNEPVTIWCAWGDLVEKRDYLKSCAAEILELFPESAKFVCVEQTKRKNPAHPLYHKVDSKLVEYSRFRH